MKKHNGRKLIYWYLAKTSFKGNRSISLFFTKKGTIISPKIICDYTIGRYKSGKELTQSQVDEIHKRGSVRRMMKRRLCIEASSKYLADSVRSCDFQSLLNSPNVILL